MPQESGDRARAGVVVVGRLLRRGVAWGQDGSKINRPPRAWSFVGDEHGMRSMAGQDMESVFAVGWKRSEQHERCRRYCRGWVQGRVEQGPGDPGT